MSEEQRDVHGKPEAARALVPLARETSARAGVVRPLAAFVAQVMACEARLPDFRAHRRAEPPDAASRYGTAPTTGRRRFERIL